MTTQEKKIRDFSKFNSYNNEPCADDEILYPVVCDEGMRQQLEADGLINRTVYPQIPPKVEYTLTGRGHSLVKVLDGLCDWGIANRPSPT